MLDVVITVSDTTPKQYVRECIRSVDRAAKAANFPINIIETPGVPGHIGQAMRAGIVKGSNKFVAFVDDDDFVFPNAFTCLEKHFNAQPTAICAREIQLLANGRLLPTEGRHHLSAWRRDVIESVPLVNTPARPYKLVYEKAWDGIVDELSWVYVYRRRISTALHVRAEHKDL